MSFNYNHRGIIFFQPHESAILSWPTFRDARLESLRPAEHTSDLLTSSVNFKELRVIQECFESTAVA